MIFRVDTNIVWSPISIVTEYRIPKCLEFMKFSVRIQVLITIVDHR
jgi:hypothetical protein